MKKLSILAISIGTWLFGHALLAADLPIHAQNFPGYVNYLVNPGFENGTYGWTASGGTTKTVNTTAKGEGSYGYDWDSSSAAQTLLSNAITIPTGLYGRNGVAFCSFKTPSGTATHTLTVNDGTNDLVTAVTITSSTSFARTSVNFPFPTSGSIKLKLASVNANEPEIYIDSCYLGEANNIGQLSVISPWQSDLTWTWTGLGTVSNNNVWYQRVGDMMNVRGSVTSGTSTAVSLKLNLPSGYTINSTKLSSSTSVQMVGHANRTAGTVKNLYSDATIGYAIIYDGSDTASVYFSETAGATANVFDKNNATASIASGNALSFFFSIPITGWNSEVAYRPETANWRVDANISGANPSLGTAAQSAYTGIEDTGLTLTNNSGNGALTAQIPCSSTNAPSGTTCAAGSESVGVSFTLPAAGDVLACAEFAHNIVTAATGVVNTTFELVETPTNAQTISQEGKGRVQSGFNTASSTITFPHRVCGTFTFASSGQKVIRLFYEQAVSATVTTSQLFGDAGASNGQRDIHITVVPINQVIPAPVLVNSVISDSSGVEKVARVKYYTTAYGTVCSADPCANTTSVSGLTVTRNATGDYTINFPSGTFSAAPTCTAMVGNSSNGISVNQTFASVSATAFRFTTINSNTGAAANTSGDVLCMGPK